MAFETGREDILVIETKSGLKTYVLQAFFVRTLIVKAESQAAAFDMADDEGMLVTNDVSMNLLNWTATPTEE